MVHVYKIIISVDNINFDTFFCKPKSEKTRDSEVNLFITHCNTNNRKKCVQLQICTRLEFANNTKKASSLNIFKNLLDRNAKLTGKFFEFD